MADLFRSLPAAALWALIFALTVSLTGRMLAIGRGAAIVAGYAVFCALQVLLIRALNLVGMLTPAGAWVAWLFAAVVGVVFHLRWPHGADAETPAADSEPDLRLVRRITLGCAAAVLAGVFVFALVSPVHIWDVLAYHMPMVASYVQNGSLDAWPTQDLRQIHRVNAGELQLLTIVLLSGSDALVELPGILALAVVLVATFLIARLALHNEALAYVVVLIVLTAPQIVLGATTAKNDLTFTAVLLGAFYWSLRAVAEPGLRPAVYASLAALCGGIAAATKVMGFNVLGAAGLLVLVSTVRRLLPVRALGAFVFVAVATVGVTAGSVIWSNLAQSAAPVGVAPGEVVFTTGFANIVAAARYYLFDLAFRRLVVLQQFEHDLSHYGYFFPLVLVMGTIAAARQVLQPRGRRGVLSGLALLTAALFLSVIAVRLPIPYDQRFMIWMVPALTVLAGSLIGHFDTRRNLVVATAAASFATFNLFLILSNEMDGMFTRSATHLATTGKLARYADVPPHRYAHMIDGYDLLDRTASQTDSILYIGSDDAWMYPAWGGGFTRNVRGVADAADAAQQVSAGAWRFVVIERGAEATLREAAMGAAETNGYRVLHDGEVRIILQRPE